MASSSGGENKQIMVDSANKPADVTIIPREHKMDSYLEEFMSQRSYDEPPYYGLDYVEDDPVSDTDDPKVESNVVGAAEIEELPVRKKSRSSAKDPVWGWLTHEYILELARTNKQKLQEDQAGVVVPQKPEDGVLEKQQNVQ
ncbi:hypothetical protein MKW98_032070 [Papaver atlanticum]|uniref:Uncharacterized protein n=1 Tax=Papaver atlanticum TaxID=357466 RepID=A0AAD4SH26_9MAGN|nr:hypothetical protein MKW98_032070 [Papaver atlanticum]